jgi:amidohydrolase
MDALPVTEEVDLPFASKVKAMWNGKETGMMHACDHDGHVAILMAAAEIFAKLRDELPGTVKLLFQPAEEGPPMGEEGGAQLLLKDGAFDNPTPEAVFGLHVTSLSPTGMISYRAGAVMAGSNAFRITVRGRQTHAAMSWRGVAPIVVGAQIVLALQTIESRRSTSPGIGVAKHHP